MSRKTSKKIANEKFFKGETFKWIVKLSNGIWISVKRKQHLKLRDV